MLLFDRSNTVYASCNSSANPPYGPGGPTVPLPGVCLPKTFLMSQAFFDPYSPILLVALNSNADPYTAGMFFPCSQVGEIRTCNLLFLLS